MLRTAWQVSAAVVLGACFEEMGQPISWDYYERHDSYIPSGLKFLLF